jgi:hypothetical protein
MLARISEVTLTYFKDSGKYYDQATFTLPEPLWEFEIYQAVKTMILQGNNPGLIDFSVIRSEFSVLVQPKDGVPYLFSNSTWRCAAEA